MAVHTTMMTVIRVSKIHEILEIVGVYSNQIVSDPASHGSRKAGQSLNWVASQLSENGSPKSGGAPDHWAAADF